MKFAAFDNQRAKRTLHFRLVVASLPGTLGQSASGCPEGTYQCTVIKNGTGDYGITYNVPFTRQPVVHATALHTSSKLFCVLKSSSTSACEILVYTDAGAAADATEVDVTVTGWDVADQI